ncbi:hypothetical protein M0804_004728 [Polistes exclamans]|nr:hypothetical protein M0804_004728 [Polistes exclamans]
MAFKHSRPAGWCFGLDPFGQCLFKRRICIVNSRFYNVVHEKEGVPPTPVPTTTTSSCSKWKERECMVGFGVGHGGGGGLGRGSSGGMVYMERWDSRFCIRL